MPWIAGGAIRGIPFSGSLQRDWRETEGFSSRKIPTLKRVCRELRRDY